MVKRVLVSAGPIPAKLDSVKVLTNRFKGGLAAYTARLLAAHSELCVHVVAWKGTKVEGFSPKRVHYVKDIEEYLEYVKVILPLMPKGVEHESAKEFAKTLGGARCIAKRA